MTDVLCEICWVLEPGGHVAFEVGEVHGGKIKLEQTVVPCGMAAGFEPMLVLINDQQFTKTANCWGREQQRQGHEYESGRGFEEGAKLRRVGWVGVDVGQSASSLLAQ